jgi:hypothetical protein
VSIDIRQEAEELVRYHAELVRRLAQSGVQDVAELLARYDQLRRALDTLSKQEIGWAAEQVARLVEALVRMDANLQALGRLKRTLDVVDEHGAPPGLRAVR